MSVLSATAQAQVEDTLVEQKIITRADLADLKVQAKDSGTPLFSLLVTTGK
jgi:hypothetical protein